MECVQCRYSYSSFDYVLYCTMRNTHTYQIHSNWSFFCSLFQTEYKLLFAVSIEIIFLDESSAKLFYCAGISNCRIICGIVRTCAILKSNLFTFKHKHNKWVCCCLCNPNCVCASCVLCFYI